jgi:hypothetical protein
MIETLHPILPKTPVLGLRLHIGRSGLCIGDPATLHLSETGEVELIALVRRQHFGIFRSSGPSALGHLGPVVARMLVPALQAGSPLRVRIVGLTPEHLCGATGPEVHVSVWADPRHLRRLGQMRGK